jgi:hypothetical protein
MAKIRRVSRDRGQEYRRFVIQKALIEKHFPCFNCTLRCRQLKCEGRITPSEGCATYRIQISYKPGGVPEVRIKEPRIIPSASIHMYPIGTLCLYQPSEDPWKSSDDIHRKIIPWTAEWLVFYELYLIYNKWLGPEAPHGANGK